MYFPNPMKMLQFILQTENEVEITGDGETWGKWGDYSQECVLGSAICGVATEHKKPILGDNTATTDMKFYCCNT